MKHLRAESGQSLVESAALIVLLVIIVLGVVDFTFIFRTYLSLANAANVGATNAARSLAAANNLGGITAAALSETSSWGCIGQPTVTTATGADSTGGSTISVTISCEVAGLIAIPNSINHVVATATVVRRIKQ
jgi:Flp pilus assembly protein TadG